MASAGHRHPPEHDRRGKLRLAVRHQRRCGRTGHLDIAGLQPQQRLVRQAHADRRPAEHQPATRAVESPAARTQHWPSCPAALPSTPVPPPAPRRLTSAIRPRRRRGHRRVRVAGVHTGRQGRRQPTGDRGYRPADGPVGPGHGQQPAGAGAGRWPWPTFTAPASGPGGVFAGTSPTASVTVGAKGVATAPLLVVNKTAGNFTVTAAAEGGNAVTFDEVVASPGKPAPRWARRQASASGTARRAGLDQWRNEWRAERHAVGNWLAARIRNLYGVNAGSHRPGRRRAGLRPGRAGDRHGRHPHAVGPTFRPECCPGWARPAAGCSRSSSG